MDYIDGNLYETVAHGEASCPLAIYHDQVINDEQPQLYAHWHDEFELCYIPTGKLLLTIEDTQYLAQAGDCFFINKQAIHSFSQYENWTATYSVILFKDVLLSSQNDDFFQKNLIPFLSEHAIFPIKIDLSAQKWQLFSLQLQRAFSSYHHHQPGWQFFVKTLVFEFASIIISDQLWEQQQQDLQLVPSPVSLAIHYMKAHLDQKIYIADLAATANLSPEYFCRCFKEETGITAIEYLNRLRIKKAASLLATTSDSVITISHHVGFENVSYFNRIFKNHF